MNSKFIITYTIEELSEQFGQYLLNEINSSKNYFHVALSGGSTPKTVLEYLSKNYKTKIEWNKIKLFWVDERCVPADHMDSNYKMTYDSLISRIRIPPKNIFRIHGELEPQAEAVNYSRKIKDNIPSLNNLPRFDLITLGLGEDGHTASIFPEDLNLFQSKNICSVTEHPITKQKRITTNGNVINNAKTVIFLVTGKNKSKILDLILKKRKGYETLPASYVNPVNGTLIWFIDKDAGSLIKQNY